MSNLIKKNGKTSVILFTLFPYLEIGLFWLLSKLSLYFWIYLLVIIVLFFMYLVLFGIVITYLITNCDEKKLIFNNFVVKLGYVPLHCGLLLLAGGMGNPFLFLFMSIPLLLSAGFTIMTGILSTICFVKSRLIRKDKSLAIIWKVIFSYIFILDMCVAILEFLSFKKREFSNKEN